MHFIVHSVTGERHTTEGGEAMTTEVAKKEETLPALTPEELAMGTGQEELGIDDLVLPKIQISAAKSQFMKEGSDKYIDGLKDGYIFNTFTENIYGKEVTIAPIRYAGPNRVLFTPSFGVDCKSDNAVDGGHVSPTCDSCEFSKWGSDSKGPGSACTYFENYVVDVLTGNGKPEMVLLSFKKKAIEAFKRFRTYIHTRKVKGTETPQPMYRGAYKLYVGTAPGKSGEYSLWAIKQAGAVKPKDLEATTRHFNQLTKQGVALDGNE
jgi:hypothetical protein